MTTNCFFLHILIVTYYIKKKNKQEISFVSHKGIVELEIPNLRSLQLHYLVVLSPRMTMVREITATARSGAGSTT